MAIQYPKSTHVTLPSVESWAQNTNILRDPPKSIVTRRIDKVGQNTDITDLVDDSGDRICEGINVFARGVNPMVSVSYDNYSSNAGMNGNPTATSGRISAKPPYPAFEGGAFRPPVRTQRDLLPLSRLPRAWFGTVTSPEFIDYAKTKQQPNDYRAVKEFLNNIYNVSPNKTTNIDKGIIENFKMFNHINDEHITLHNTDSGKEWNYFSSFTRENADVQKGAMDEVMHAEAISNKGHHMTQSLEGYHFNPNKYIEEQPLIETYTNPSAHRMVGLDENQLHLNTDRYIGDINQIETTTNRSQNRSQNLKDLSIDEDRYIQDVQQISRNTNRSANLQAKKLDELFDNGRVTVKDDMIHVYDAHSGKNSGVTFLGDLAKPVLEMRNPMVNVTAQRTQTEVSKRVDHVVDYKFDRNMPMTNCRTNITKIDDFSNMNLSSRDVRLDDSLKKGGFGNVGSKPVFGRTDVRTLASRESDKDRMRNRINLMQFNRD